MLQKEWIDTTVPVWLIIMTIISSLGMGIWTIIKMYFSDKDKDRILT